MAATRMEMVMVMALVLVAAMWEGGMAKSCPSPITSIAPCMDFVMGISKSPSSKCCKDFEGQVKKEPECVCQVIGFENLVKKPQFSKLPKPCNVDVTCDYFAPAPSPSGKENSSSVPSSEDKPGSGSDDGKKSDGNSIKLPFSLLFFVLFITSYASTVRLV